MSEGIDNLVEAFSDISDQLWGLTDSIDSRASYLCNQLMRAIDSVGANICEGFGREYAGSLRQFYGYARGSALEAAYWLDRAISRKLIPVADGVPLLCRLETNTATLEGIIGSLPKGKS